MSSESKTIPGLRARLDRLVYYHDTEKMTSDAAHAFIYFITISNLSDTAVTIKGRRWVICESTGHRQVIEGEGIVGKEPLLEPGNVFSYNSYHLTHCDAKAEGAFHGVDHEGRPIHIPIPSFEMTLPISGENEAMET